MYCIKQESRSKGYEAYFSEYIIDGFQVVPHFVYINEHTESFKIRIYIDDISVEEELDNLLKHFNIVGVKTRLNENAIL